MIGEADYAQSLQDIDHLAPKPMPHRAGEALHAILQLDAALRQGTPREQVRSTLDLGIQDRVTKLARARLDLWQAQGARQVALVVADRATMQVLAWVGSGRYGPADAGEIDYATRARSPGSTLKPFIYAEALESGAIQPTTILVDDADNGTGIDNADHRFLGPLLPRQALGNSRNVPAAKLVAHVGLDRIHWFFARLGLHDGARPAARYGLSLAVGGMPTGLDRVVAAYGALANDGMLRPLVWYDGEVQTGSRVMSRLSAAEISNFLADPMARLPSFNRMGATEYPFPVSVKTGTSQGFRDAWTAAYSDRYVVGVWVGRPDGRPMTGMTGATSAALVHDVLINLHGADADGLHDTEPKPPQGLTPVTLCAATGRPGKDCDRQLTEYVKADTPLLPPIHVAQAAPPPRPRIATPGNNAHYLRNPETPELLNALPLRLASDGTGAVIWYADGEPLQTAQGEETIRWKLQPGRHVFQARRVCDDALSLPVSIEVE